MRTPFKRNKVAIDVEVNGADEAVEKIDALADAMQNFQPQVVIRNCRDCEFEIYPSQTRFISKGETDD